MTSSHPRVHELFLRLDLDNVWYRDDLVLGDDLEATWLVDPRRREPQGFETPEGPTLDHTLTECAPMEESENRRWFEVDRA